MGGQEMRERAGERAEGWKDGRRGGQEDRMGRKEDRPRTDASHL